MALVFTPLCSHPGMCGPNTVWGVPCDSDGKKICLWWGTTGFDAWVGKIPWRRAWQPTPEFLPGESPWTEESGGLQSVGSQRVGQDWATKHSTVQLNTVGRTRSTAFEGLLGDKNDKTEHQTEKIHCDTLLLTENELSVKDFKTIL